MSISVARLRLFNRLNYVLRNSQFVELVPLSLTQEPLAFVEANLKDTTGNIQGHTFDNPHGNADLGAPAPSLLKHTLQILAFEHTYALECRDFGFLSLFQDFKDLDPSNTDPLLLLGAFELFVGGLIKKASDFIKKPITISEYLVDFAVAAQTIPIDFYLKFHQQKFACTLYCPSPEDANALEQMLKTLSDENPQWEKDTLCNPELIEVVGAEQSLTDSSLGASLGHSVKSNQLTIPLSLQLGTTTLRLSELLSLKCGSAILLDVAYFQQDLLRLVYGKQGAMAKINKDYHCLQLTSDFAPLLDNFVSSLPVATEKPNMNQDENPQNQSANLSDNLGTNLSANFGANQDANLSALDQLLGAANPIGSNQPNALSSDTNFNLDALNGQSPQGMPLGQAAVAAPLNGITPAAPQGGLNANASQGGVDPISSLAGLAPQDMPNGMPLGMPQGTLQGVPQEIPQGMPRGEATSLDNLQTLLGKKDDMSSPALQNGLPPTTPQNDLQPPNMTLGDWTSNTPKGSLDEVPPLYEGLNEANANGKADKTLPLSMFDNLQLELSFELERRSISLGELRTLTKGSVLPLNDTGLNHVAVVVNQQVVAKGQIVSIGSNCALKLNEICHVNQG